MKKSLLTITGILFISVYLHAADEKAEANLYCLQILEQGITTNMKVSFKNEKGMKTMGVILKDNPERMKLYEKAYKVVMFDNEGLQKEIMSALDKYKQSVTDNKTKAEDIYKLGVNISLQLEEKVTKIDKDFYTQCRKMYEQLAPCNKYGQDTFMVKKCVSAVGDKPENKNLLIDMIGRSSGMKYSEERMKALN